MVRTDLIQFLMILVAMILLLFVSIFHPDTSFHWDGLVHAPKGQWILRGREIFFLTFMGSFLTPPIFQRIKLSGEKRGFQVFALSSLGILGIGLASGVCGLIASQEASHESTLNSLLSLMENYWPMGPIVLLGILAAMLSTSDSLVNSLAVTLVRDVFRLNEKKTSPLIWSMFTPMLLAGLLALSESGIWGILFKSYTLWAPTLLIPLLALFVGKTVSHQSFFTGNFVGLSCSLLGMVMPEAFLSLTAVELGVGLHLIFYISAYQWEKRKK